MTIMQLSSSVDILPVLLTISGTLILLLLAAVVFFVVMLIREVKQNTKDVSKLYGITETQRERHNGELKVLAERTEMQIQQVTKNVGDLTNLVRTMIKEKLSDH